MHTFLFDCGACGATDVRQATAPILKYVSDGKTKGSVECCLSCVRDIETAERTKRAKEAKAREAATASEDARVPESPVV
jgi:hypothetical protein